MSQKKKHTFKVFIARQIHKKNTVCGTIRAKQTEKNQKTATIETAATTTTAAASTRRAAIEKYCAVSIRISENRENSKAGKQHRIV